MRRGVGSILLKLGVLVPVVGILVGGISALVSGAFAMLGPLTLASTASVALAGSLTAVALAGTAAFVGFKGVGQAIKDGMDPKRAEQFAESMKKVAPAARPFIKEFIKLKDEFKGIRDAAAQGLFPGLERALSRVAPILPRMRNEFKILGQAAGDAVATIAQKFTSLNFRQNMAEIVGSTPIVVGDLAKAFGNLGQTIAATLAAAAPLTERFTGALRKSTKGLRDSAQAGKESGKLQSFFNRAGDAAAQMGRIIRNVVEGLFDVGKVGGKTGQMLFDVFEKATKGLADYTNKKKNVDGLKKAFDGIGTNVVSIGGLVKELGKAFLRMGANPGIGKTADALKKIVPDIERALNAGVDLGPKIAEFVGEIAKMFTALQESGGLGAVVDIFTAIAKAIRVLLELPFAGGIIKILAIVSALSLLGRVAGFAGKQMGKNFASLGNTVRFLNHPVRELNKRFPVLSGHMQTAQRRVTDLASRMREGIRNSALYDRAQHGLARAHTAVSKRVTALRTTFTQLRHPLQNFSKLFPQTAKSLTSLGVSAGAVLGQLGIGTPKAGAFGRAVSRLTQPVTTAGAALRNLGSKVMPQIQKSLTSFGVSTGAVLGSLGISGPKVGAFGHAMTRLSVPIKAAGAGFKQFGATAGQVMRGVGSDIAGPVKAGFQAMSNAAVTAGRAVGTALAPVSRVAQTVGQAVGRTATTAFNGLSTAATKTGKALGGAAVGIGRFANNNRFAAGAAALAAVQMSGLGGKLKLNNTLMGAAAGLMLGPVGAGFGAIAGFAVDAARSVTSFAGSIKATKTAIGSGNVSLMSETLKQSKADIATLKDEMNLTGIGDGITDFAKGAGQAFKDLFQGNLFSGRSKRKAELEQLVQDTGILERDLKRLNGTNVTLSAAINVGTAMRDITNFKASMKDLGKPISLDIKAPGGVEANTIVANLSGSLQELNANGLRTSAEFKQGTKALGDFLKSAGAGAGAVDILTDTLAGVTPVIDQIPADKKIKISAEDRELLNRLGVDDALIQQLVAEHNVPLGIHDGPLTLGLKAVSKNVQALTKQPFKATLGLTDTGIQKALNTAKTSLKDLTASEWKALVGAQADPALGGTIAKVKGEVQGVDKILALATVGSKRGDMRPVAQVLKEAGIINGKQFNALVGAKKGDMTAVLEVLKDAGVISTKQFNALVGVKPVKSGGGVFGSIAEAFSSIAKGVENLKTYPVAIQINITGIEKIAFLQAAMATVASQKTVTVNVTALTGNAKLAIAGLARTNPVIVQVTALTGNAKLAIAGLARKAPVNIQVKAITGNAKLAIAGCRRAPVNIQVRAITGNAKLAIAGIKGRTVNIR